MDGYIGQFCSVLRAGLWNTVPEAVLTGADMRRIWNDARKQAVSGLIAQGFLNTGRLDSRTTEMLQNKLLSIAAMNFKQTHILADSVRTLEAGGVHPILLKGFGVASYYHQPLLRESGDIDLYVRPDVYKKSFDLLIENLNDIEEKEFNEGDKHSVVIVNGIPIELHQFADVLTPKYNAVFQDICSSSLEGGFRSIRVDDINVQTPEPTFNAMFIFEHIWSHFVAAGVGFRQLCDWVMLIHNEQDNIDRNRLGKMLDSLDFMKPWKVFGYIAVNYLGLPEVEMPFYDSSLSRSAEKVLEMIIKEGNFGHEREDRWKETGHPLKDTIKHFLVITRRYCIVIPMFGNLAFQEYKNKILYHLVH